MLQRAPGVGYSGAIAAPGTATDPGVGPASGRRRPTLKAQEQDFRPLSHGARRSPEPRSFWPHLDQRRSVRTFIWGLAAVNPHLHRDDASNFADAFPREFAADHANSCTDGVHR